MKLLHIDPNIFPVWSKEIGFVVPPPGGNENYDGNPHTLFVTTSCGVTIQGHARAGIVQALEFPTLIQTGTASQASQANPTINGTGTGNVKIETLLYEFEEWNG